MFIHNRRLKNPLEMAVVTDTNMAIQPHVSLSIREAVLNICGAVRITQAALARQRAAYLVFRKEALLDRRTVDIIENTVIHCRLACNSGPRR